MTADVEVPDMSEMVARRTFWGVVLALACINAIGNSAGIATPLWIGSAHALGLTEAQAGLLASVQLFAAAGANVAASQWQRRFSPRAAARGILAVAVAAHLLAMVGNPAVFAISVITIGAALGALSAVVLAAAARFPDPHRVFAAFTAVLTAFASAFYIVAPFVMTPWGVTGLFGLLAASCAATLAATAPLPAYGGAYDTTRSPTLPNKAPGLIGLTGLALIMAGHVGVVAFAVSFAGRQGGGTTSASGALAAASIVSILGAGAGGIIGERFGRLLPTAGATMLIAASIAMIGFGASAAAFLLGMILFFTSVMFVIPYYMSFLASLDGEGRWIAIGPSAIVTGSAVGPAIGSTVLAAGLGTPAIALAAIGLVVLGFLSLVLAVRVGPGA